MKTLTQFKHHINHIGQELVVASVFGMASLAMMAQDECTPDWGAWQVLTAPTITASCPAVSNQCGFGNQSVGVNYNTTNGVAIQYDANDCENPPWHTNALSIGNVTYSWTASGCGASPSSGATNPAIFALSSCGTCTVSFTVTGTTTNPVGSYSASASVNFKIGNSMITGGSSNAVINNCTNEGQIVSFSTPCEATWSIASTNGTTGDASIDGSGNVTVGTKPGTYIITAISTDNPSCSNSVPFTTTLDCVCNHHLIAQNVSGPPGWGTDCAGTLWNVGPFVAPCSNYTAQLSCISCTHFMTNWTNGHCYQFLVNGSDVGHCLYGGSSITGGYYPCKCGSVIMGSRWDITETGPPGPGVGAGYVLTTTCDTRIGPNCFDSTGHPRTCVSPPTGNPDY